MRPQGGNSKSLNDRSSCVSSIFYSSVIHKNDRLEIQFYLIKVMKLSKYVVKYFYFIFVMAPNLGLALKVSIELSGICLAHYVVFD